MSITGKHKNFAMHAEIKTRSYRGHDRRRKEQDPSELKVTRHVRFDDRGNPVMDLETNTPRRRRDDEAIDMIECLAGENPDLELSEY